MPLATSGRRRRRLLASSLTASLAVAGAALGLPASAAPSTTVLISEVYGGGGNAGATLTHDFVELYNAGTTPVDLTGWSVRYSSATGTTFQATALTGRLQPGTSYLVQEARGSGGTTALPTPDAVGSISMSATSGRIDLVDGQALVDRVGYGTATTSEGAAAPAGSNTTSVERTSPCTDTDSNAADLRSAPPSPRSTAAGAQACTVAPPEPVVAETIEQIQGASHLSPLAGKAVDGVRGVVTALSRSGFWFQSTTPDADPATSEGLFVFTRTAPTVTVGDDVSVDGAVSEFRPGGAGGNDNLTTTQIGGPTVTVLATGAALPAPVVLGVDRVAPPQTVELGDPGSVEYADAPFRPATDAIDFYESLDGMRVGVRDARVVGPTASFGEIPVVPGGPLADTVLSPRGGVVYSGYDHPNASRVQLDDALLPAGSMPAADVGDRIPGQTDGVLDYSFSNYKLLVTSVPVIASGGLRREVTQRQTGSQLAVATFNVENLAPSDPATKFERLAQQIVTNLQAPDVLALEEIQDDSGAVDDGVVTSGTTVATLVRAITAAGGPAYQSRTVDPQDGTDGGQPGGNIRQVLLFRTDRGLGFVDRTVTGADPTTTATEVTGGARTVGVTLSPGRIQPSDPAWRSSRKPLVGQLRFRGQSVFVIANHFASKGGDDPLFGRWQQPVRSSEVQRTQQAALVRGFVDRLLAADPAAKVVVLGDINDFEFSRTADVLVGGGSTALTDLPRTLPVGERYTYVFQGNSQVLDHILISPDLSEPTPDGRPGYAYDVVHTNSEFADQDSDHDPQVVRLSIRGNS